jgi:WD40 repeat protein
MILYNCLKDAESSLSLNPNYLACHILGRVQLPNTFRSDSRLSRKDQGGARKALGGRSYLLRSSIETLIDECRAWKPCGGEKEEDNSGFNALFRPIRPSFDCPVSEMKPIETVLPGYGGMILSVCLLPDGLLASVSNNETSIRIWSLSSERLIKTLSGHTGVDSILLL